MSENVVDLVSAKLRGLPPTLLSAVMVGSCLGSRFDRRLVLKLLDANVLSDNPEASAAEEPDFGLLVTTL